MLYRCLVDQVLKGSAQRGRIKSANLLRCLRSNPMSRASVAATCTSFQIPPLLFIDIKIKKISFLKTGAYRRNTSLRHLVLKHLRKLADLIRPLQRLQYADRCYFIMQVRPTIDQTLIGNINTPEGRECEEQLLGQMMPISNKNRRAPSDRIAGIRR